MSYQYYQTAPNPEILTTTAPDNALAWWLETPTAAVFDHFAPYVLKGDSNKEHHIYIDNGADVLAIGHLDTVQQLTGITGHGLDACGETIVEATGLDDRLGAYAITHLLPFPVDLLYLDHEETGNSTAQYFTPPTDKKYRYVLEFDRAGTDAVTYDIDCPEWLALLRSAGAQIGNGSFTDLCYLEQEQWPQCMVNFGSGYYKAHSIDSYANLDELAEAVELAAKVNELATAPDAPAQWEATNKAASNRPSTYRSFSAGSYGYNSVTGSRRGYDLTNRIREAKADPAPFRSGAYVSELFDATFIRYCAACGLRMLAPRHYAVTEWPFCADCEPDLAEIVGTDSSAADAPLPF
jgi:hypothetical protein